MFRFFIVFLISGSLVSCGEDVRDKPTQNNSNNSMANTAASSNNGTTTQNNVTTNNGTAAHTQGTASSTCSSCPTPDPYCDGKKVITFEPGCENGVCTLGEKQELDCAAQSKECKSGACIEMDLCANIECTQLRARCEGDVLHEPKTKDKCNPANGKCEGATEEVTDCAASQKICKDLKCQIPAKKRVFVTDGHYLGDLMTEGGGTNGVDGADKICALEAQAANLPGTFKAWISTENIHAVDRLVDVGPWYHVRKTSPAVESLASLVTRGPNTILNLNAKGSTTGNPTVWTGTSPTGRLVAGDTCSSWTKKGITDSGAYGRSWERDDNWTQTGTWRCDKRRALYCFEQ